jgi:hypothetical protein
MTATILAYGSISALIDGQRLNVGSIDTPASFIVNGQKHEVTWSIANGANAVIYANSLGAFNTVAIECDFNTRIVLTDTASNVFNLGIRGTGKARQYGLPLPITLSTTINAATTINSIVVHNESGSTAKVHAIVIK